MNPSKRTFLIFLSALPLLACERKIDLRPHTPNWDRDVCTRCGMSVSDRLNSAQIIDAKTGEAFMFDDLGCAIAWLDEKQPAWRSDAIVYVNDASDGAWLKVEDAVLATPYITPMSFGISAFRSKEKVGAGKTVLTLQEAKKMILDTVRERKQQKELQQNEQQQHQNEQHQQGQT
ncbi:MAG: nitrous oxide reductase accessory protein NosL [Betaproteobacteria bacterium]|nr:nitrous oxide reductase accessory protein NosL [Betaproteobacteria bacterium]